MERAGSSSWREHFMKPIWTLTLRSRRDICKAFSHVFYSLRPSWGELEGLTELQNPIKWWLSGCWNNAECIFLPCAQWIWICKQWKSFPSCSLDTAVMWTHQHSMNSCWTRRVIFTCPSHMLGLYTHLLVPGMLAWRTEDEPGWVFRVNVFPSNIHVQRENKISW